MKVKAGWFLSKAGVKSTWLGMIRHSTIEQIPVLRSSSVMTGGSQKGSFLWLLGKIQEGLEIFLPTLRRD